jgi:hypothetical protein
LKFRPHFPPIISYGLPQYGYSDTRSTKIHAECSILEVAGCASSGLACCCTPKRFVVTEDTLNVDILAMISVAEKDKDL